MAPVSCPKCGCEQIVANKQGFGLGKAAIGGLLAGRIGLLAGFLGSSNINITCLKCGHSWSPQDPVQNQLTGCLIETIALYAVGIAVISGILCIIMLFVFKVTHPKIFFICAGVIIFLVILYHIFQYFNTKKIDLEMKNEIDHVYKESTIVYTEPVKSVASKPIDGKGPEGLNNFKWGRNENINSEKLQPIENNPDEAIYRITRGDELLVYGHKVDSIIYSFYKENLYKITVYFEFENRKNVVEDIRRQIMYKYGRHTTEIASIVGWDWHGVYMHLSDETLTITNYFYQKRE
jgi:hypothetical protein